MKHPHDEVIRAWLDGKEVQFFDPIDQDWITIVDVKAWVELGENPDFNLSQQYRVKPDGAFRVWLDSMGAMTVITKNYKEDYSKETYEEKVQQRATFKKWLTDWIDFSR